MTDDRIAYLKSELRRLNPVDEPAKYIRLFDELMSLEGRTKEAE